jgi:Ca2+-binding RTX toxin-like protein
MPTLTVTATTDYRFTPNSNLVTGQNITDIIFASPGTGNAIVVNFNSSQFGGNNISNLLLFEGDDNFNVVQINVLGNFNANLWGFVNWDPYDEIAFYSDGATNIVGSSASDRILGADSQDTFSGGNGNDILSGQGGSDTLRGDAGNDYLYGGPGDDALDGGSGQDTAVFLTDSIFADLTLGFAQGEGFDSLLGVENISAANGNDTLYGNELDNSIDAGKGENQLFGRGGNDTLSASNGNDVLDGGTGVDFMVGSAGNDTYIIDDPLDIVFEASSTGGYDVVFATANYTLPTFVEQLVLRGGATQGTGNSSANYLYGGESGLSLMLDGGAGHDIIYAGLAGHNTLNGGDGVDTLLIYGGDNLAYGGDGDDIYYTYSVTDTLIEAIGGGYDTVFANWNITLGANLDQLVLFGAASVAVGNADNNIIYGNSTTGPVNLFGMDGADVLYGGAGFDTLSGGAGNDQLFGLGGINTLYGGADGDIYYFAGAASVIIELANEGFDTVYTNVAYAMADNTEQLIHYGSGVIFGNASDNYISTVSATAGVSVNGAAGNDYIFNSDFADTLEGGLGNDQLDLRPNTAASNDFIRYGADGNMGNDTIYGFDSDPTGGQDIISLVGRGYVAGNIGTSITIAQAGTHTLVNFAAGSLAGTTLLFFNLGSANVTAGDFLF